MAIVSFVSKSGRCWRYLLDGPGSRTDVTGRAAGARATYVHAIPVVSGCIGVLSSAAHIGFVMMPDRYKIVHTESGIRRASHWSFRPFPYSLATWQVGYSRNVSFNIIPNCQTHMSKFLRQLPLTGNGLKWFRTGTVPYRFELGELVLGWDVT
ncbi:uncharacterized protein A4U43_C01F24200 [Asparagus officinalis]|uniref:Uncharacterized protein n=1 Tax=Asparagus officinalis TaxID=4686 RepID=A0A5P1FTK0_ASPOF|nr:uncharacterized protein A4U43_C01F24200 [Asparagus officinalis]